MTARRETDAAACRRILADGSKSFWWASRMLPASVRRRVEPVYAFCRVADDLIDEGPGPAAALRALEGRLDAIYGGAPADDPVDRQVALVARRCGIPRGLFDALLDGFRWEVEGRSMETLSDVRSYSARVASAVGAVVTVVMGVRDRTTLARACELGLAMQLTNIARDVGEDARAGRCYLPREWFAEAGLAREAWLRRPAFTPAVAGMVGRLLAEADDLYLASEAGIPRLPMACRPAIWAARMVYADIGRVIRGNGMDSVSTRAFTSRVRKARLLASAVARAAWPVGRRRGAPAPVVPEVRFLLDAAAPLPSDRPGARRWPGELLHTVSR